MNDVSGENFTPADVETLTSYVASHGLAGLTFLPSRHPIPPAR